MLGLRTLSLHLKHLEDSAGLCLGMRHHRVDSKH